MLPFLHRNRGHGSLARRKFPLVIRRRQHDGGHTDGRRPDPQPHGMAEESRQRHRTKRRPCRDVTGNEMLEVPVQPEHLVRRFAHEAEQMHA